MGELREDWLFSDVPNNDKDFIAGTFINRKKQLTVADRFFKPDKPSDKIYAIHGASRIGKSHLAMHLVQQVADKHHLMHFYVNANKKGCALDILRAIYSDVNICIQGFSTDHFDEDQNQHHQFLRSYLNDMNQLILLGAKTISLKNTIKLSKKLSPKFKAKLPFVDIEFGGEKAEGEDQTSVTEFEKPDVDALRTILCLLFELMGFIHQRTILILVDDLDLLEELASGEDERNVLTNQLKFMAEIEHLAVFITTRRQYFIERGKEMVDFIGVPLLTETDLKSIYNKRIALFYDHKTIFDDDTVNELAKGFKGMVGAFLYECFLFFRNFIDEPLPLTRQHLQQHIALEIEAFRQNPETEMILFDIENTVQNERAEMVNTEIRKEHGFMYRVLIPKGYKQDTYTIMPLFAKALKAD